MTTSAAAIDAGFVEFDRVQKSYDGVSLVVKDLNLKIGKGEFLTMLGPSGSGKTTCLMMLAGFETATHGEIKLAGRNINQVPPHKRGIGMVFQNYALFPHMTVRENVAYGLQAQKWPRADIAPRVEEMLKRVHMAQFSDRYPKQLSGGQQQRVALGRAIVAEAPVCLMDEPLSNLDAQLRVEMRREIRELQQRLGITMVYVTHDQVEAMTMADQVVLMRNGRIEQDAPPDELYENPATIFVARFVGTPPMNVIPLSSLRAKGAAEFPTAPRNVDPALLAAGIRPEQTELSDRGVEAEVMAVEYLGADTLIETRIDGHSFIVRRPGKARAAAGDVVRIALPEQSLHWFHRQTEQRLRAN